MCCYSVCSVNPFNPEFTVVIYIHYKPRIAVAIPVDEDDLKLGGRWKKYIVIIKALPWKF